MVNQGQRRQHIDLSPGQFNIQIGFRFKERPHIRHRRVVHEQANLPIGDSTDDGGQTIRVSEISDHRVTGHTKLLFQFATGFVELVCLPINQNKIQPLLAQALGPGATNALRSAGYHGPGAVLCFQIPTHCAVLTACCYFRLKQ